MSGPPPKAAATAGPDRTPGRAPDQVPGQAQGHVPGQVRGQAPGLLSVVAAADALAVVPEAHDSLEAGAEVALWWLDRP